MLSKLIKKPYAFIIILSAFIFLTCGMQVSASQLNFAVEPEIPKNQRDKSHTYFDLRMKAGEKQTLKIRLRNDTKKDVIVTAEIHPATTNIAGTVEYGKSDFTVDDTAPYNIAELVKPETNEITVPAEGSIDLKLNITMPKEEFTGFLAGGITLKEKDDEAKKAAEKSGGGMAIENKYAYALAILLSESDEAVPSKLTLNKVDPGQVNARNVINATLQNPQPKYLNQVSIKARVTKKGKSETLYKSNQKDMQMAPNTSFVYPVPLEGEPLKAGKYTLYMTVKTKKDSWDFEQDFEIKADVARALNKKDVTIKKDYTWIYILIGILLLLIIIALIFYVRHVKKKQRQQMIAAQKKKRPKKKQPQKRPVRQPK